ncbi:cytochrome P450 [Xylariaceae sp. AK1471]|nr:cytochrome P450 [Xylariaceae sp. AK1471]
MNNLDIQNGAVFLGFSLGICALCFVVVYRLYFHPLARYPGPILHRLCGIPTLYHAGKGDLHYHLYALHYQYGKFVRYSPNKVSINSVKALPDIYGFNKNTSKPEEFYSAFRVNKRAINTFNTSSKEAHRRKRRIMAKAFSETSLQSYEAFISFRVAHFMRKLRVGSGQKPFQMAYEFNCLMLDIMGGLCFGEAFGFVDGRGDTVMAQAHKRTFRIYMTGHEPLLKRLYLDRLLFPQLTAASNVLGDYAKFHTTRRIEKHSANIVDTEKGYEDIMAHLLEAGDEETGTKYSSDELLGEGILMMMAGSDTSSSALTATVFYLSRHPAAMRKLRSELTTCFQQASDIEPRAAENCRYLRACIDEAMRLSPPAPTNIPRVVGEGGISIDGEHFQSGVYVGVPNFTLFRNGNYFESPHTYKPERWIVDPRTGVTEEDVKRAQAAFQPFSLGPRHCIGRHLAMKEVSVILANLLHTFDIEPVGKSGELTASYLPISGGAAVMEQHDVYTSLEDEVLIQLHVRKGQI